MKKIHLYLKTHKKTGFKYLGITTKDPCTYLGSGVEWKKHIKLHGRKLEDIKTEVLYSEDMIKVEDKFTSSEVFRNFCKESSHLYNIVENKLFANAIKEDGIPGAYGNVYKHPIEKQIEKLHEYDDNVKEDLTKELESNLLEIEYNDMGHDKDSTVEPVFDEGLSKLIDNIMIHLSPRQAKVIRMRYGIHYTYRSHVHGEQTHMNCPNMTFTDIARQFDVTSNCIKIIHDDALRKIIKVSNEYGYVHSLFEYFYAA